MTEIFAPSGDRDSLGSCIYGTMSHLALNQDVAIDTTAQNVPLLRLGGSQPKSSWTVLTVHRGRDLGKCRIQSRGQGFANPGLNPYFYPLVHYFYPHFLNLPFFLYVPLGSPAKIPRILSPSSTFSSLYSSAPSSKEFFFLPLPFSLILLIIFSRSPLLCEC